MQMSDKERFLEVMKDIPAGFIATAILYTDIHPIDKSRGAFCGFFGKNGHHWHICVEHGIKVEGHGDHSGNTFKCTCGKGSEKSENFR